MAPLSLNVPNEHLVVILLQAQDLAHHAARPIAANQPRDRRPLDDLPPVDVAHDIDGDAIRGLCEAAQLGPELNWRTLGFEVHLENALMVVLLEHHNVGLCGRVVCDQF